MGYFEKLAESILADSDFKINQVSDISIVKSLSSYHQYIDEIISILKNGNYKRLDEMNDDSKSFDDITVIKFKGNNNQDFYGIVYDDWALETDPIVTRVFRSVSAN
jgi:hypothetical protein